MPVRAVTGFELDVIPAVHLGMTDASGAHRGAAAIGDGTLCVAALIADSLKPLFFRNCSELQLLGFTSGLERQSI
jgi:hypothetical protein